MSMYKLECYKAWDNQKLSQDEKTSNLAWLLNKMHKPYKNYYHKLYEKVGNR